MSFQPPPATNPDSGYPLVQVGYAQQQPMYVDQNQQPIMMQQQPQYVVQQQQQPMYVVAPQQQVVYAQSPQVVYAAAPQPQQTTIVVQGPPPATGKWMYELFDCFADFPLCLKMFFCFPCIVASSKSEMDNSSCCCNLICFTYCCVPCNYRSTARRKFQVPGTCIDDWIMMICCPLCSAIQIERQRTAHMLANGPQHQRM